jgi:voltage-gated potassium channel Kch
LSTQVGANHGSTGWRRRVRWLGKHTLPVLLMVEALGIFGVAPLIELRVLPREMLGVTLCLILALGMLSLQRRQWVGRLLFILGAILLPIQAWRYLDPSGLVLVLQPLGTILFLIVLSWALADTVFRSQRISIDQVLGGVVLYLNVGLTFTLAFTLIEHVAPGAFLLPPPLPSRPVHPTYFAYFSFVTLTTVGYGDTVPVGPIARALATLESTLGQLFPAIILARLVSIEVADRGARMLAKQAKATERADGSGRAVRDRR